MIPVIYMSFDGNIVRHLVQEFNNHLTSGRINKIYQISKYDLIFNIHSGKSKHQLLISSSPNYARIHLSDLQYEKPDNPPTFCMFLRKHLEGGTITNITQNGNDRVITFTVNKRNELGDKQNKHFIVEVMGRHSNIVITDDSFKILESIKHSMPFDSADRTIFPGAIYHYPSTNQLNPYDPKDVQEFFASKQEIHSKDLQQAFVGFSPLITKEIMYRYEHSDHSISDILNSILHEFKPGIYYGKKDQFYFTDLHHLQQEKKEFDQMNTVIDRYYYNRDSIDIIKQRSKDIIKLIKNMISRLHGKIEKLNKDLLKAEKRDDLRIKGELIQANIFNITKGDRSITCVNYYTNTEITISLDPLKTPVQNSEMYFKKYKKLKNSIPHIHDQIKDAKDQLQYFNEILHQTEHASLKDIEEIKDELVAKKYLKEKQKQKKKNKQPNFDTILLDNGIEILVGKNNVQNEYITHKLAHQDHVWFHVKEAPGSHVLVKSSLPLDEYTIRTAALIAAYYSKLRSSSSVPVDYVQKRHLKKVPGKVNSFVTYTNHKTIYIDPDEDVMLSLTKK